MGFTVEQTEVLTDEILEQILGINPSELESYEDKKLKYE